MKVILDTNVFISGIFWSGPPYTILQAWKDHKIQLVTSTEILDEYIRVQQILAKKHKQIDLLPLIDLVALNSEIYTPVTLTQPVSRDPDDDKFIACAISAKCKVIISGDKDLLVISGYAGIEVFKPSDFVDYFLINTY